MQPGYTGSHLVQSLVNACRRQKISTTYARRMARNNLVIKMNIFPTKKFVLPGNLSLWEILATGKSFFSWKFLSLGNICHREIFSTWKSLPPGIPSHQEIFPPGNPSHREFLPTRKPFPPGNPSHREFLPNRKSFTPGIPSHQEILHTGNSFPPEIPSLREFLPIRKSFTPGIPSHQKILPTSNSLSHQEILHTKKFFRVNTRTIIVLIEKCFSSVNLLNLSKISQKFSKN